MDVHGHELARAAPSESIAGMLLAEQKPA